MIFVRNGGFEQCVCENEKGGCALHLQTEVVKMALTLVLQVKLSDFRLFGLLKKENTFCFKMTFLMIELWGECTFYVKTRKSIQKCGLERLKKYLLLSLDKLCQFSFFVSASICTM